jgi:hypothetical protein
VRPLLSSASRNMRAVELVVAIGQRVSGGTFAVALQATAS